MEPSVPSPAPFAIARSMLSFGIEYERAFSIAFWRARFDPGSEPPSFAATMIARDSFEKSLPRFASAAPFLCLIVDHLLCPDTRRLRDQLNESFVDPGVVGQLGMERGDEHAPVAQQDRLPVELREHLDTRTDVADARCADEDATEGPLVAGEREVRLEARDLAPVRVPIDDEVGEAEMVAIDEDHSRARAEDRRREPADRLVEAVERGELEDRRRLAARDHEPVEPL